MNQNYSDMIYVFHTTKDFANLVKTFIEKTDLSNCEIISDDKIKSHILQKSIFAVAKSGTISLEISNFKIPSIIIYKMNFINFFIIKRLVKTRFANILNIAADEELIPELLQSKCNSVMIYNTVSNFLENPNKMEDQINKTQKILNELKIKSPSDEASLALNNLL